MSKCGSFEKDTVSLTLQQGYQFNQNQVKILSKPTNNGSLFLTESSCDRKDYREIGYPNVGVGVLDNTNFYELINRPTTFRENFQNKDDSSVLNKPLPTSRDVIESCFSELNNLDIQFNSILEQYKTAQTSYTKELNMQVDDANFVSSYQNKNVTTTDNKKYYVNSKNVAKPYMTDTVYSNTENKNNCPAGNVSTGSTSLPNNVNVGTNMIPGQSCGNEGTNVYVNSINPNPITSYIGCYRDPSTTPTMTALSNGNEIYDYDSCLQVASDNNSSYFSLKNVNSETGLGKCNIGNDLTSIQKYGVAYDVTINNVWSSGTEGTGPNTTILTNQGNFVLQNSSNQQVLWTSNDALKSCVNGGMIKPNSFNGSYGMNCNGKGYDVTAENASSSLNSKFGSAPKSSWSFGINNSNYGDPAPGCGKNFSASYTCGDDVVKTVNGNEGETAVFNCTTESNACVFYLMIKDDGNLCVYQGTPSSNPNNSIWCTNTITSDTKSNPDWVAKKGKYGVSYLKTGQSLSTGEWIGSSSGNSRLIMDTDGALRIYASVLSKEPNCLKTANGKLIGNTTSNAVYSIKNSGFPSELGKIGYVNENTQIQEYPNEMVSMDTSYTVVNGYDSLSNTKANGIYTNTTIQDCQRMCNGDSMCVGFVFDEITKVGELKTTIYPKAEREPNYNKSIHVRNMKVNNANSCNKKVKNIDSILWKNYPKNEFMTSKTNCGLSDELLNNQNKVNELQEQLHMISSKIVDKVNTMENMNFNIDEKIGVNNKSLEDYIKKYHVTSRNIKTDLTIDEVNRTAILADKKIYLLEENYKYMLWTTLAIAGIILTMNIVRNS